MWAQDSEIEYPVGTSQIPALVLTTGGVSVRFRLSETVAEDGIRYLGRWGDGRGGRDLGSRGRE